MRFVVLKEKHGNRYFDASTDKKLYQLCKDIVNARVEDGYWYSMEELVKPEIPVEPDDFYNQPQYIKDAYDKALKDYNRAYSRYLSDLDEQEEIKQAMKNGKIAYRFLSNRSREYEGFELIEPQDTFRN